MQFWSSLHAAGSQILTKFFLTHFEAMDTDANVNAIPAIIVQGGWFAMNANPDVYRQVSERAASEGHNVLTVSLIRFFHAL